MEKSGCEGSGIYGPTIRDCDGCNPTIYGGLIAAGALVAIGIPLIVIGAKREPVSTAIVTPWATPHGGGSGCASICESLGVAFVVSREAARGELRRVSVGSEQAIPCCDRNAPRLRQVAAAAEFGLTGGTYTRLRAVRTPPDRDLGRG